MYFGLLIGRIIWLAGVEDNFSRFYGWRSQYLLHPLGDQHRHDHRAIPNCGYSSAIL